MKATFADIYFYLALMNRRDSSHQTATLYSESIVGRIVTTEWVLVVVADALAAPRERPLFLTFIEELTRNPDLQIVDADHQLFLRGVDLFRRRPDKDWRLTDCLSFVVMQNLGITEALTAGAHFAQAGFVALLAEYRRPRPPRRSNNNGPALGRARAVFSRWGELTRSPLTRPPPPAVPSSR